MRIYLASVINIPLFSEKYNVNTISKAEKQELLSRKITFLKSKFKGRGDFNKYLDHCDSCIENCDYAMELTPKLVSVLMAILSTLQTVVIQSNLSHIADIINFVMTALSISILLINAVSGTVIRKLYQTSIERCRSEFDGKFWAQEINGDELGKNDIENVIWPDEKGKLPRIDSDEGSPLETTTSITVERD